MGYTKNLPDGAVLIEIEGEAEALEQFVLWAHHGPEAADVEKVEVENAEIQGYSSFFVKE